MDSPGRLLLESTGDACSRPDNLPELSRFQSTLDASPRQTLLKSKSLRTRPQEAYAPGQQHQHAAPSLPLNKDSANASELRPELRPRQSSKMSLFSLFSKPKVEKLRGYAEQGLATTQDPPCALSNSDARDSKQNHAARLANANAERPTTSRSYTSRAARLMSKEAATRPLPSERQLRSFEPPPLFQVWPQTTKHGTLETTTPGPEVVLHRPRSRVSGALFVPGGDNAGLHTPGNRASIESRTTIKTQIRHMPSGSFSQPALPKKLVVLVTSGYLLQYAETGANDRLPEKILELGKDSAAYASDLIPGKYHVLQIAQAVDQRGVAVSGSHSIFSKIGLRNHATRRAASDFLLIMNDADEMGQWITAIRKEIENQGGKRSRSDSSTLRPQPGPPKIDLKKTPSQSHRYNVRRSPNGPSAVSTPTLDRFPSSLSLALHTNEAPPTHNETHVEGAKPSEKEQDQTTVEVDTAATRPRAGSDTPSISSSAGASVEHQQLEKLRNSARVSHTSTAATSVTAASRTNSMTSSPSEYSKDSSEGPRDTAVGKPPFRSLSSYSLLKRRSAAPLSLKGSPLPETGLPPPPILIPRDSTIESPVVGRSSPFPEPTLSPKNSRLMTAQSVPNLKSSHDAKRDSKIAMALTTPPEERPQSFLADLPSPANWSNRASPGLRTPISAFPPLFETSPIHEKEKSSPQSRISPTSRPLRSGSNSFSLPLRATDSTPARSPKRTSTDEPEGRELLSPIPAVTCLTAKVDLSTRTTIDSCHIPKRSSSNATSPTRDISGKRASAKLSLFPSAQSQTPPHFMARLETLSPSASTTALAALVQSQAQAQKGRLSRPASLQVRNNQAPFLSNARSTTTPNVVARSITTTAPIRSLKPSRSVATMQTVHPSDGSFGFDFGTNGTLEEEEATDEAKPLPQRCISPAGAILGSVVPRPSSRNSRVPRSRTSLPHMDFGLHVSALGPPAPPPSAPLPEIPDGQNRRSVIRSGTPIGLAIGEAIDEHSSMKENVPHALGLGIKVGGESS